MHKNAGNKHRLTHGMSKSSNPTYKCWDNMIQRCTNPKSKSYKDYGGRGISVCPSWLQFETFLLDMGHKPEGKSLDRKDNDAGYSPSNCRWATKREQRANRRDSTK